MACEAVKGKQSYKQRSKIFPSEPEGSKGGDSSSNEHSMLVQDAGNQSLTPQGNDIVLREAQAKGLPNNWRVKWKSRSGRRVWISPTGRKYYSLPQALSFARGIIGKDMEGVKKATGDMKNECSNLTLKEVVDLSKKAQAKGLPNDRTVKWNIKNGQRTSD
jgi:hypothetical protein